MGKLHRLVRLIIALGTLVLGLLPAVAVSANTGGPQAQTEPDIRFVLQTQGRFAAYATLTNTITLDLARPLFTSIAYDGSDYLQGAYTLAGRTEQVQLAIGAGGWAVVWQPPSEASQDLFDCPTFQGGQPGVIISRPERALGEIAVALGLTNTVTSFYDFRNPQAKGALLQWLFLPATGSVTATVALPLTNNYLERGYAFCTALTNSKLWLNGELIDQQGIVTQVVYRNGPLATSQLRAGQINILKIETFSIFGSGFLGGITTVYTGTTPLSITGGYSRTLPLVYPNMLGAPLTIYRSNLPLVTR
jgi:hypothetical protein